MINNVEQAVVGGAGVRWPHNEIVGLQVLEEVHSAGVVIVVAAHLNELRAGVDADSLEPVAFHDNFLRFVAQAVDEHVRDDAVVNPHFRVAFAFLVLLGHAGIVGSELSLVIHCAEQHTIERGLRDSLHGVCSV